MSDTIVVETPARLHFGLLDLRGSLGRRFGGIGAPAPGVSTRVAVALANDLSAVGPDSERAKEFASRFLTYHGLSGGARIVVERSIPPHSGLGSGTQLALSVARALAELHCVPSTPSDLARSVRRAERSAVGTWTFAGGGFVVEGGRRSGNDKHVGPLLARVPFPSSWRCVLAMPDAGPGVSGAAESQAFAHLSAPDERDVERAAYLVLMAMLPALAENDLAAFGAALSEIQEINGRWFSGAQGGLFAPGASTEIIRVMRECGAPGVGQSSWGPAVYAVVDGDAAASALVSQVQHAMPERVALYAGSFPSTGASISRS